MIDQRIVKESLAAIETAAGIVTPAAVVHAARDPNHPLHECFTWDDSEAAEKYREVQARKLIVSVTVTVRFDEAPVVVVPCYVRSPDALAGEQGYARILTVTQDEAKTNRMLRYEVNRAKAVVSRARDLATAASLAQQLDGVVQTLALMLAELEEAA